MADDVLVDAYDAEHQPSTPLASSDSESANTSTSRVYFGPVQSAEKRHIRPREQAQHTPIRRSTRHLMGSSLALRIPKDDVGEYSDPSANEVVASDLSRPDTPTIPEDALEEPSSALASKVLSACGNPSPPPSPLLPSRGALKDVNDAATDEDNADISLLPLEVDSTTHPLVQETITEDAQTHEAVQSDQPVEVQADEVDLINFDSFASPPAPLVHLFPATPPRGAPCSVDDLLAPTPMRLPSGEVSSPTAQIEGTASAQEDAPPVEEVQPSPGAALEAVRQDSPPDTQPFAPVQAEPAEPSSLLEPAAHTPLRRSTRPRRSVSPYVSVTPSKSGQSASSSPKVEVGSVRRKRTKASERDSGERLLKALDFSSSDLVIEIPRTLEDVSPHEIADNTEHGQRATSDTSPRKGKEPQTPEHPRLRSLSPTSTSVLSRLLSSSNNQPEDVTNETESRLLSPSTPKKLRSDDVLPTFPPFCLDNQVPERPSTPIRDASPQRKEVGRTPARRIPLSEAIAQGTVSPVKASTFASSHATANKPVPGLTFLNPRSGGEVMHSPAKRVPIGEVMPFLQSPSKQTTRSTSPAKSSHVRSMSEDPIQPIVPKFKRSMSAEPVRPSSSVARPGELRNRATLAHGASHDSSHRPSEPSNTTLLNIPPSIQESDEAEPQQLTQAKPKASSSLRPPSSRVESKIPRPGSKPYARPAPVSAAKPTPRIVPSIPKKALPHASTSAAANVPAAQTIRPMRMVRRVVTNKPPVEVSSGSDDMPQPVAGSGPRTASGRLGKPPSKPSPPNVDITTLTLKRKREADEAESSRASPVGVKPVVLIRKVPPPPPRIGKPPTAPLASRQTSVKPSPPSKSSGPVVVNGGLKLRKAVGKRKPESPARSPPPPKPDSPMDVVPPSPPTQSQALHQPSSPAHHEVHETPVDIALDVVTDVTAPAPQLPTEAETTEASTEATVALPSTDGTSETEADAASHGLRRGSRPRKAPTTDVFGVVAPLRGAGSKRRTILLSDTSVFSGMSAIALKSLTNTNTQRNQRQVVEIRTEVVLKEGKRPDSPTTKVRTSLERLREERVKEREERAARRARRSEGEGDPAPEEDPGDVSLVEVDVEISAPLGHPRAPGDEEDYTTPERPRPAKRSRLGEDLEERDAKHEKRVKWNHGLATTVYLNDTPPKPKRPPSDAPVKKGCLAPSAKARPLDTMGNVLNAEAPVPDVQPENIVVKKFVYEDDEPPAAEPAPAPAPAKSTRSKSKKSRT